MWWHTVTHGRGKWRGNWRMEWVASTLHTTSEHGVSSITTADAHTSAASSRMNWRPCRLKWTRPFRRKTKSGFCACAIAFQTQSTCWSVWPASCWVGGRVGVCRSDHRCPCQPAIEPHFAGRQVASHLVSTDCEVTKCWALAELLPGSTEAKLGSVRQLLEPDKITQ